MLNPIMFQFYSAGRWPPKGACMVLAGTCTVRNILPAAINGRLLWDVGTPMIIQDWKSERSSKSYIKKFNLNEHPCVTALDPDTALFAHTITQRAALPNHQAYDISFTVFWHNKVEHCLRRWIKRHRKIKAVRAVQKIELAILEWMYKPGGKGFHKARRDFNMHLAGDVSSGIV